MINNLHAFLLNLMSIFLFSNAQARVRIKNVSLAVCINYVSLAACISCNKLLTISPDPDSADNAYNEESFKHFSWFIKANRIIKSQIRNNMINF